MHLLDMAIGALKSDVIATYKRLLHLDIVTLTPDTKSDKNVLLSYITHPFRVAQQSLDFNSHTNELIPILSRS